MLLSIGVRLIQQFAGTFQQRGRYLTAAGDPSQLRFAGLPVQLDDSCERPSPALPFSTEKWVSAIAASCGRWVTQSTCLCRAT